MAKQAEKVHSEEVARRETSEMELPGRAVVDQVTARVQALVGSGELHLPADYSVENAMMQAWLILQDVTDKDKRPALEVCTKQSVSFALLDMAIQGLSPAKSQCYFIVYGKSLVCQRSYFGTLAVLKRIYGQATEVFAATVYEGDELEYEIRRGRKYVTVHRQKLANVDGGKIVAAYAVIEPPGREPVTEIMTFAEVKRAWQQGQTKGQSPAHQGFPGEMAEKTVIGRAAKILINSSNDSHLARAARRQDEAAVEAEVEGLFEEEAHRDRLALPPEDESDVVEVAATPRHGAVRPAAEPETVEATRPAERERSEAEAVPAAETQVKLPSPGW